MENYHIYEEKGRGEHCVVYKGREKKTVNYVAIKSVDKGRLDKVLHEVRIMYRLDHPNCLQFHRWYETRHHVWLILEYCTGGSFKDMLQIDPLLPESSVRVFGSDLVNALHYLHRNGILYCDLKPSNVLMNEYGILKLSDFALARSINEPRMEENQRTTKQGTPCCMAPELFSDEGVYSCASDLWALGCILYQMALGHVPFESNSLKELVHLIRHTPLQLPSINDSKILSVEFKNLLRSLLRKDPMKRISWPGLINHEFWQGLATMPKLEPMPVNAAYLHYLKTRRYVPRCSEEDSDSDEGDHDFEINNRDEFDSKTEEVQSHIWDPESDSSRMSIVAKRNLLRESTEDYIHNSSTDEKNDLQLENLDKVLDFEHHPDFTVEDDEVEDKNVFSPSEENLVVDFSNDAIIEPMTPPPIVRPFLEQESHHSEDDVSEPAGEFEHLDESSSEDDDENQLTFDHLKLTFFGLVMKDLADTVIPEDKSTIPSVQSLLVDPSDRMVRPILGNNSTTNTTLPVLRFNPNALPFENIPVDTVAIMRPKALEAFLSCVFKGLSSTSYTTVISVLGYLYTLSTNARLANVIVSSSLVALLTRLCTTTLTEGTPKSPSHPSIPPGSPVNQKSLVRKVKIRVAVILAVIIRFATYIAPRLGEDGLLSLFVTLCQDSYLPVRRYGTAALGELLFYISVNGNNINPDDSIVGTTPEHQWKITGTALKQILTCLRTESNEDIRAYAAKTYENVLSTTTETNPTGMRFATADVAAVLLEGAVKAKLEPFRGSCAMALAHLVRLNRRLLPRLAERDGWNFLASGLQAMQGSSQVQQAFLNILLLVLRPLENNPSGSTSTPRRLGTSERLTRELLFGSKSNVKVSILQALLQLASHAQTFTVRCKALLVLTLFLRNNPKEIAVLLDLKLIVVLDRLFRKLGTRKVEDEELSSKKSQRRRAASIHMEAMIARGGPAGTIGLRRCLYLLLVAVASIANQEIANMSQIAAKMASVIASGRLVVGSSPGVHLLQQAGKDILPVLVHVNASKALGSVVTGSLVLVEALAKLVKLNLSVDCAPEFDKMVMILVEAVSSDHIPSVPIIKELIPALWKRGLKSGEGEMQIWCLRLSSNMLEHYLELKDQVFQAKMKRFIVKQLLPSIPKLIEMNSPLPQIGVNLLRTIVALDPDEMVALIFQMQLPPQLFKLLSSMDTMSSLLPLMELLSFIIVYENASSDMFLVEYNAFQGVVAAFVHIYQYLVSEEMEVDNNSWQTPNLSEPDCSIEMAKTLETAVTMLYKLLEKCDSEIKSSYLEPVILELSIVVTVISLAFERQIRIMPPLKAEKWFAEFDSLDKSISITTISNDDDDDDDFNQSLLLDPVLLENVAGALFGLATHIGDELVQKVLGSEHFVVLFSKFFANKSVTRDESFSQGIHTLVRLFSEVENQPFSFPSLRNE